MSQTIYLKDYKPPRFNVEHVSLCFELSPENTIVTSLVTYERNQAGALILDGEALNLKRIAINGKSLSNNDYKQHDKGLIINQTPNRFTLEIVTHINPQSNTALEGLYRSSGNYCTQCEAQGFRRITYYQDRPDVMATFSVKIIADKSTNPVLLSNGNPVETGDLDNGLHYAKWHDPFAKPCYLFALVAGNLAQVKDVFTTQSGRKITLKIFTEAHHIHQCSFAMASLKRAMAWDEQRFGLVYDLDLFMIVAVDDFNMGAMENKGLNIFNSRLVFASPETATDDDYIAIEAVIGHEYFHNWTGNRVTCRDWFQLSLKEGLTVFRDQEFTADHHDHAVKRIEDVRLLQTHQFAEDASPMTHPIRPASYMEINNFYTVTVYEKGAEVVRLYQTLLGRNGFRKGMDLYFERHDGQAVTTEDFLNAMADANNTDLSQMQTWYEQAGTPRLRVRMNYDAKANVCTLICSQSCPTTPESEDKQPFLIPLRMALLDSAGNPLELIDKTHNKTLGNEATLMITKKKQSFSFTNITSVPTPSLLRDFSAPITLDYDYSDADYAFLMQHDDNAFNRWAATQALAVNTILNIVKDNHFNLDAISQAFATLLRDQDLGAALKAEALSLPSQSDIQEVWLLTHAHVNPVSIFEAREHLQTALAHALKEDLLQTYTRMSQTKGSSDQAMQQRKLQGVCLSYLMHLHDEQVLNLAKRQFDQASNMTTQYTALALLANHDCLQRKQTLETFEQQWIKENNVMDKWFSVQASSSLANALNHIKNLMKHPKFTMQNPNKVRALIGGFAMRNPKNFHAKDGLGYAFVAEQVLTLDRLNPQVAARIVRSLMDWKRLEPTRQTLMFTQLKRIADSQGLSGDVFEIVSKSLRT